MGEVALTGRRAVSCQAGTVDDDDARVYRAGELGNDRQIIGVDHRRMVEAMLGTNGQFDALLSISHPDQRQKRHHLLFLNERMLEGAT